MGLCGWVPPFHHSNPQVHLELTIPNSNIVSWQGKSTGCHSITVRPHASSSRPLSTCTSAQGCFKPPSRYLSSLACLSLHTNHDIVLLYFCLFSLLVVTSHWVSCLLGQESRMVLNTISQIFINSFKDLHRVWTCWETYGSTR